MAKPKVPEPAPAKAEDRLPWPSGIKELSNRPRLFRIHRLNAFEWQAYITEGNQEYPMGKPDLFEIVRTKVSSVMRAEGQMEFMEKKTKAEKVLNG